MYEATITFMGASAKGVEGWAEVLGWTYHPQAHSPYGDSYDSRYCSLTLQLKGSERLLEDMRYAVGALNEDGIPALRQQIVCVVYDSKTGEDWISEEAVDGTVAASQ